MLVVKWSLGALHVNVVDTYRIPHGFLGFNMSNILLLKSKDQKKFFECQWQAPIAQDKVLPASDRLFDRYGKMLDMSANFFYHEIVFSNSPDANMIAWLHDGAIKLIHFRITGSLRGESVDSPHTGQWRGALMFYLTCTWTNGWANNRDAGDLRRHRASYDVTVMSMWCKHIYVG